MKKLLLTSLTMLVLAGTGIAQQKSPAATTWGARKNAKKETTEQKTARIVAAKKARLQNAKTSSKAAAAGLKTETIAGDAPKKSS